MCLRIPDSVPSVPPCVKTGEENTEAQTSQRENRRRLRIAILCFHLISLWCVSQARVHANDEDARFVAGLRERRLFTLAETYCLKRLETLQPASGDRVELAVELIRVYADHALNSRGSERDSLWQKAADLGTSFEGAEHPRVILIRVQAALTLLARGELSRMESEVASQPDAALVSAREMLREAATALTAIDRELTDAIPIRRRNPLRPDELSADELTSLQNHVRYQLARAYKNQALCFPAESSDRTASLTAAIDQLEPPLLQLAPGQSLYVDLRLEQIACLRLLGDTDSAAAYLKMLGDAALSSQEQLSTRAERIRWCLAESEPTEALKMVTAGRSIANVTSAELDFAFLETYVSLWKSAADNRDQEEASRWRDKSIATAKFVEQEHGAYWARRAEILLVRVGAGSGDGSVDILRRTADDLYRKGNLVDAIAAYDKAATAAMKADESEQSFELSYKASLVHQQQMNHVEAATRFRQLALDQPTHPYAANSHLLAIANTRQASIAASKWLDSYPDLLREHLANWPNSNSASTVAFWLGEFEVGRRSWKEAVDVFSRVSADSDHFAASVKSLGECWLLRLGELITAEQTQLEETQQADEMLRRIIVGDDNQFPADWSPAAREAVLAIARIQLQYGGTDLSTTESILKASLAGDPQPSEPWRVAAQSLLVGVIARQPGRESDAREMLLQVGMASTSQLFLLFQQVAVLMESATGSAKTDLARLVADVAKRLESQRTELDPAQNLLVDQHLAKALAATGATNDAYDLFSRIAKEHSSNASVQEDFARFLLDSDDKDRLRQALDQWRLVAARTRPRTDRWFRAKYSVAVAHFKLNDKAGAAKLIRYLQATEDLAPSGIEKEFDALLSRCTN